MRLDMDSGKDFYKKHFKRNFIVATVAEGLCGFALGFIVPATILSIYISQYTSSKVIIGLIFAIPARGNALAPVFSAYINGRVPLKKKFINNIFVFYSLGWFAIAFFTFFSRNFTNGINILLFLAFYAFASLASGFLLPVFMDFAGKIFPGRVGTFLGAAFFISGIFSILAGWVTGLILDHAAFPYNYAICFLLTAVFFILYPIIFNLSIEEETPLSSDVNKLKTYLKKLFSILKDDKQYPRIFLIQVFMTFIGLSFPFFAVYAGSKIELTGKMLGYFTIMLSAGSMIGSFLMGILSDHTGHRSSLFVAVLCGISTMIFSLFSNTAVQFCILFFLCGVSSTPTFVVYTNIILEIASTEHRASYVALNALLLSPFAAILPILGGFLINKFSFKPVFMITLIIMSASLLFIKQKEKGGQ